ncbi:MAG: hypothetical protein L6Q76_27845, partial [Polyangiaceae bacterium]|nr:hypothetical protein [Polyangiaceae bacterium]
MPDRRRGLSLAEEALDHGGVAGHVAAKHLEGEEPAQRRVLDFVKLPRRPLAQHRQHFVAVVDGLSEKGIRLGVPLGRLDEAIAVIGAEARVAREDLIADRAPERLGLRGRDGRR